MEQLNPAGVSWEPPSWSNVQDLGSPTGSYGVESPLPPLPAVALNPYTGLLEAFVVGNDLALDTGVGTCGKNGQSVPVGVGLPTIRINGLTVGGTRS